MKKIFVIALMFAALNAFAQTGVIMELSGQVELKRAGAATYVPARAGDSLAQDTVISTGFKSTALVEVGSAVIVVRPLTRLTLTEISASAGSETLNMNLQTGRVRVDVNPPAGTKASLSVSSPSATASVRGTSFSFDTRFARVGNGAVSFRGRQGYEVQASAGSSVGLGSYGTASAPVTSTSSSVFQPAKPVGSDSSGGGVTMGSSETSSGSGSGPAAPPSSPEPFDPGPSGPGYISDDSGGGGVDMPIFWN